MTTIKIRIDTVEKVRDFVAKTSTIETELDITSERYTINAKSIMGIFSLDLKKELHLIIHNDEEVNIVKEKIEKYLA